MIKNRQDACSTYEITFIIGSARERGSRWGGLLICETRDTFVELACPIPDTGATSQF